ncbi:DUF1015 domain-containing protein [uncultured Desulfuromusa sp.]|uniref:DUF1015 domain-containing protein n=1 Tax=uncultured Desulfuromusa sp. TaxID=219183 RepID=UPI002AA9018D|nr:DUF1015 domain-containing protein [uncultured Desulfuromusa sp.]
MNFEKIGMQVPNILLPKKGTDMQRWAVIACDQYTSDKGYWQRLTQQTAGHISTLNLVFPEAYLDDADTEERIAAINQTMQSYLADGSLEEQPPGFILVDRKTTAVESRKGLIVALDLEQYDYTEGAQSLIRSTEGTILDRLPPRIKVRRNAPIELPHIMVLIDDPQRTVIEPLFEEQLETAYDFELLENGGHLKGYRIDQPEHIEQIVTALEKLADPVAYHEKYKVDGEVMLYAMGDGNHSFATAKAIWEKLKQEADDPDQVMSHPARYALVELVNVHDSGLEFEAIHRVLFNVNCVHLQQQMKTFFAARKTPLDLTLCSDYQEAQALAKGSTGVHVFPVILGGQFGVCRVEKPEYTLTVATLQTFLDHYLEENPSARIDYIHGEKAVTDLGRKTGCVGFYLPAISKHDLFKTIVLDGALPRKTFSLGEADEKRFYLECRKIC